MLTLRKIVDKEFIVVTTQPSPATVAQFAMQNMRRDNMLPDEIFVVGFEEERHPKDSKFRMCLSTGRLLEFVPNDGSTSGMIQGDDTNSLIYQGWPVMLFGFSDMHRTFHPVLVCICTNKTCKDYAFCYNAYKKSRPQHNIIYSMSDGADAIINGAHVSYPNASRLMCWAHVYVKNFLKVR